MGNSSLRVTAAAVALGAAVLLGSAPAAADEYDSRRSGHPLRIVAYALHPVGVMADYLIFRPAHWAGSWEPVAVLFGHELSLEELDDSQAREHRH